MGKIFYIMGKSASGKDKIHGILLSDKELELADLILYTTRPIRSGETDGQQYRLARSAAARPTGSSTTSSTRPLSTSSARQVR